MSDYDVGAVSLSVPPASAVIQAYRPAVSVRNNGVHPAIAAGYICIYAAGLLIFETEVYSATIAPGATGLAQAVDYWTPPAVGQYMIFGYVTCPLDQYEPNNNLAPVTINVTGLPPPTPPPVTLHAAQHEEGAIDELSIDGLAGKTKDPQTALAHVSSHQAGGSDALNAAGLLGELATPQTPKIHNNTSHNPAYLTAPEAATAIATHDAKLEVHVAATTLEHTANKGAASGYCPLDDETLIPALHLAALNDRRRACAVAYSEYLACPRNSTTPLIEKLFPANYFDFGSLVSLKSRILFHSSGSFSPTFKVDCRYAATAWTNIVTIQSTAPPLVPPLYDHFDFDVLIPIYDSGGYPRLVPASRVLRSPTSGGTAWVDTEDPKNADLWLDQTMSFRIVLVIPDEADANALVHYAKIDAVRAPTPLI